MISDGCSAFAATKDGFCKTTTSKRKDTVFPLFVFSDYFYLFWIVPFHLTQTHKSNKVRLF